MESLPTPTKLYPYPNGWYVLCKQDELLPGQIIDKKFAGKDIIIFRTESGKAAATDAYCPHMGAHFAHGGKVQGETIECPFHFFCFDTEGTCTKTGYGTKPPPKAILKTHHLRERNGFILVWHDAKDNAPEWEVPEVSNEGWTEIMTTDFKLRSHPQETTENAVDLGHFAVVHEYTDIEVLREAKLDGPYLNAVYAFSRKAPMGWGKDLRAEIELHAHGLGYSFVEVLLPKLGVRSRQYVFPMPVDGEYINLKIGMSIKPIDNPGKTNPLLALIPKKIITWFALRQAFKGYAHDVAQDFKIWENKVYMDNPALAKGDGPVGRYRRWARQFYYTGVLENFNSKEESQLASVA